MNILQKHAGCPCETKVLYLFRLKTDKYTYRDWEEDEKDVCLSSVCVCVPCRLVPVDLGLCCQFAICFDVGAIWWSIELNKGHCNVGLFSDKTAVKDAQDKQDQDQRLYRVQHFYRIQVSVVYTCSAAMAKA